MYAIAMPVPLRGYGHDQAPLQQVLCRDSGQFAKAW